MIDTLIEYPRLTFTLVSGFIIMIVGLLIHDYDHPFFFPFMAGMGASTAMFAWVVLFQLEAAR